MMDTFIPYAKQSITEEDISAVREVLKGGSITRGPAVSEFERSVARFCEVDYAVAFNSGTSALHAAYHASRLTPFDRLHTAPNSFVATVAGACQMGAALHFVDIEEGSGNIDLSLLQEELKRPKTRGRNIAVPVHFAGFPVDVKRLEGMLISPDDLVIEDAAHAFGSHYSDGSPVGSCKWSDMTVFSFHPAKTITSAEGGVVTTRSAEYCERLRIFRDNGIDRVETPLPWYYEVKEITGNYHMSDIHAALGTSQLKRVELFGKKRRELVRCYKEELAGCEALSFLEESGGDTIIPHLFVVAIDFDAVAIDKAELMQRLRERGIATQVHYIPLYRHPYFLRKQGDISAHFPKMESYYSKALTLPLYYDLTTDEVARVARELSDLLKSGYS